MKSRKRLEPTSKKKSTRKPASRSRKLSKNKSHETSVKASQAPFMVDDSGLEFDVLSVLLNNLPGFIVFAKDEHYRFLVANPALVNLYGLKSVDEMRGKTDFDYISKEIAEKFRQDDVYVMRTGNPIVNREEINVDSEGNQRWLLTTKVPLRDKLGKVKGILGVAKDITEIRALKDKLVMKNNELKEMSLKDTLTGAYNRGYLQTEFAGLFQTYSRQGKALTMILYDIDNFKGINDNLGHLFGDRVLQDCAVIVENLLRRESDVFVRYGGDEFIIALPGMELVPDFGKPAPSITGLGLAGQLLRRIRELKYVGVGEGSDETDVTISIGVASLRKNEGMESLMKRADEALYMAKKQGKDRVVVHPLDLPGATADEKKS